MRSANKPPVLVAWTLRLEQSSALEVPVRVVEPVVRRLVGTGARASVLRGEWLGHAVHPLLTDLVIGTWTSASVLDLVGGRDSPVAARRLIGVGLLAAGPTAWTGWSEWATAGEREKRTGLVHALTNGFAVSLYAASWVARRRDRQGSGTTLALVGAAVSGAGAYLGGHLAAARKVGSHHLSFDQQPLARQ